MGGQKRAKSDDDGEDVETTSQRLPPKRQKRKETESAAGHPFHRFKAPGSIPTGTGALARVIGPTCVELIAESFAAVHKRFDSGRFVQHCLDGLGSMTFKQRSAHIAAGIAKELPGDFSQAQPLLLASLPPAREMRGDIGADGTGEEKRSLSVFFFLPHSHYISEYGAKDPAHFAAGMEAVRQLTMRSTSEFCLRAFLLADQARALGFLREWVTSDNVHVRRLVSEGTRPRLPWASRLKDLDADPTPVLPLLEALKDDIALYVRRSVANHLGDIAKSHRKTVFEICKRWIAEVSLPGVDEELKSRRFWMVRHALRHPAKQGDREALHLRSSAQ